MLVSPLATEIQTKFIIRKFKLHTRDSMRTKFRLNWKVVLIAESLNTSSCLIWINPAYSVLRNYRTYKNLSRYWKLIQQTFISVDTLKISINRKYQSCVEYSGVACVPFSCKFVRMLVLSPVFDCVWNISNKRGHACEFRTVGMERHTDKRSHSIKRRMLAGLWTFSKTVKLD